MPRPARADLVRMAFANRTIRLFVVACAVVGLIVPFARIGRAVGPPPAIPPEPYDWATWRTFWSFQPVRRPALPPVREEKWVRNPIDRFVLARLQSEGLTPAPEASKLTLIRRATFDLLGLPPLPEEIRAFERDTSPDAYEKLIERLLASPHYGERWGRHWLDVARYTPGRISFPGQRNTAGDTHYGDYVVRAFNEDKPYDQFLTEQLAGDLLPATADREQYFDQITAPAFLSIGAWFDMCTDPNRLRLEMIDEQVNATTQAFMGLSVACARCHDHKFDPIPTSDYYALAGIFRSTRLVGDFSEFWRDGRVRQLRPLAMPEEVAANNAIRAQIDERKARQWELLRRHHAELTAQWKADEARYRAAAAEVQAPFVQRFEAEQFDGQDNLRIAQLMRDGVAVEVIETQTPKGQWVKYKVDVPETGDYRLDALYCADEPTPVSLQANGTTVVQDALAEPTGGWDLRYLRWRSFGMPFELRKGTNFLRITSKEGSFPRLDRLRVVRADQQAERRVREVASAQGLNEALLASFVIDRENPWPTVSGILEFLDASQRADVAALSSEMGALAAQVAPYPLAVAVTDQDQPVDLPVHIKGDTYSTTTYTVPRGVPRLLSHAVSQPTIPNDRSGRLELARWLTERDHPLTSRVMVNRIWHWHFGRGIVASTSDFGSRGERPTHPELLDWLAAEFMDSGWSMKHMHRLIMTSATYRQSAIRNPQSAIEDPENKLLSHFSQRRLEAEVIYDAMRSTTNMIPRQESGKPLDVERSAQRAMYNLTNGRVPQGLGGEMRKFFPLFDYELSGVPVPVRPTSSTPSQSLFFLNNPLPKYLADRFAERLLKMDKLNDEKRLEMAYLQALGRPPGKEMSRQALQFIEQCQSADGMTRAEAWSKFCHSLYATAEFRYVE